jgi:hypothetical protein
MCFFLKIELPFLDKNLFQKTMIVLRKIKKGIVKYTSDAPTSIGYWASFILQVPNPSGLYEGTPTAFISGLKSHHVYAERHWQQMQLCRG